MISTDIFKQNNVKKGSSFYKPTKLAAGQGEVVREEDRSLEYIS